MMNHREKFIVQEGPLESTGPLALPHRVTETAAVGPGVRWARGAGYIMAFLSSLVEMGMKVGCI